MKQYINLLAIIILVISANLLQAQTIKGSAHDFSSKSWSGGKICIVCHTPHNGDKTVSNAPLWNHKVTAVTNYTLYTGQGTLNATVGQPSNSSKLCLSCHDGTVALDNFGGVTNGTTFITGTSNFGSDLSNDHPISFTYDAALATADKKLFNPATTNSGLGSTIQSDMLFQGKMECASCHDVHNGTGIQNLLVKSDAASALCLTCHNK